MERTRKSIRSTLAVLLLMVMCTIAFTVPASAVTYQYKAVKVRNLSRELSNSPFASVQGNPGVTVSISTTKSVARSYSYTANGKIGINDINGSIGWSKSSTDTITVSKGGSWKVPSRANNKNVKYGTVKGYYYFDRVEYKVLRRTVNKVSRARGGSYTTYGDWVTDRTGCIAKKVSNNNVAYKTFYTYK